MHNRRLGFVEVGTNVLSYDLPCALLLHVGVRVTALMVSFALSSEKLRSKASTFRPLVV